MSAIQGAIDEVEKYIRQLQDLSARLRECEGILAPKGREAAPDKVRDAETASLPVKTKPARKGKPRKGGGGNEELRAAMLDVMAKRSDWIGLKDVRTLLKTAGFKAPKAALKYLLTHARKEGLIEAQGATMNREFRVMGTQRGSGLKPALQEKAAMDYALPKRNDGKLTDMMREVIGEKWGAKEAQFTRDQVEAELKQRMANWDEKMASNAAVNLGDMADRGELHRKGYGRMAIYMVNKLKGVATPEREIHVPRDSDTET